MPASVGLKLTNAGARGCRAIFIRDQYITGNFHPSPRSPKPAAAFDACSTRSTIVAEIVHFIFFSEIVRLPVMTTTGRRLGRIVDLTALTTQVYPKVTGLIVRRGSPDVFIPWNKVKHIRPGRGITVEEIQHQAGDPARASENEILLRKSFLDRQIISISGNKVVRVNDLHLLIDDSSKENSNLWLVHIDIGVRGLLRRLGWERFFNGVFRWVTSRDIREKFVPWKYVQPTEMTNVFGSLHLKIDASRLSEVHPADIADILEDLGTDERITLLGSLAPATAAAALQEVPIKLRVSVGEEIDPKKFAGIIQEMPADEAVDLLDELSPERRNAVYAALPAERAAEIHELSKLSAYSVGSIMSTDFVAVPESQTVQEVIGVLKAESHGTELIYYMYVTDAAGYLKGVVTMRQVLLAGPSDRMSDIMTEHVIAVEIDTNIKRVAQIFFKYNFLALPVIDEERKLRGIITLRDALEKVFPEMTEESGG